MVSSSSWPPFVLYVSLSDDARQVRRLDGLSAEELLQGSLHGRDESVLHLL